MNKGWLANLSRLIRGEILYRFPASLILCIIFILLCKSICAQQINIDWQKSYGGTGEEYVYKCKPTLDSGFLIVGATDSDDGDIQNNYGRADIWILKLDSLGIIQWSKNYGGSQGDIAVSFDLTQDGGYIIGGGSASNDSDVTGHHGNGDYWDMKLDSVGNIEWQKCYGGTEREVPTEIHQTYDLGYIISGDTDSDDGDVIGQHACLGCSRDYWILKLDRFGAIEWQRCLGGVFDEKSSGITQTNDSGFVAVGSCVGDNGDVSGSHGLFDYWVVKLSNSGTILWQKCLGGSNNDGCNGVISTNDGGCLVFGESSSLDGDVSGNYGNWDSWLVKLDVNGNIEWEQNYGGTGYDSGKALTQFNDSTIFLLSFSLSNDGDVSGNHGSGDFWFIETDGSGNIQSENYYGGSNQDFPYSICAINNHQYLLAGGSNSHDGDLTQNHGGICSGSVCDDYWMVKLSKSLVSVDDISYISDIKLFPNPFKEKLSIRTRTFLDGRIIIVNTIGEVVHQIHGAFNNSLDLSFLIEGIYFLEYSDRKTSFVKKIVKIK